MDAGLIAALRAPNPVETASRALPEGGGWLYVETGGATRAEAEAAAQAVVGRDEAVRADRALVVERSRADEGAVADPRGRRRASSPASPDGGEAWPGWEDAAVPPERFGAYLREFDALLARHGRRGVYYGHFGDGCLHVRIDFDLLAGPGIADFRAFMEDAADLVVAHGGSLSGEHGDGAARAELLPRMYPPQIIAAFEEFKADLGPGRPDEPRPRRARRPKLDDDLRVFVGLPTLRDAPAAGVRPRPRQLHPGDPALPRRRQVRHRARRGDVPELPGHRRGDALHPRPGPAAVRDGERRGDHGRLAVAGGRRGAGPVPVLQGLQARLPGRASTWPTYKTEFLAQRYRGRRRPAAHYSMGALPRWLHLVGRLPARRGRRAERRGPGAAGRGGEAAGRHRPGARDPPDRPAARSRGAGGLAASAVGSGVRSMVALLHSRRSKATMLSPAGADRRRLLLWPDTFTNHFDPAVAADAVAVLEALGYTVELPPRDRLLRADLDLHRPGRRRPAGAAAQPAHHRAVARRRRAGRRAGAVLHRRPARRTGRELLPDEPLAARARRRRAHVRRGARRARRRAAPAVRRARAARAGAGALPPARRARHRGRPRGAGRARASTPRCSTPAAAASPATSASRSGHYEVSMACAERVLLPGGARRGPRRRGARRRLHLPHPAAPGRHPRAGAPGPARRPGARAARRARPT